MSSQTKGNVSLTVNLEKLATTINLGLPVSTLFFAYLGFTINFNFQFITVTLFLLTFVNCFYLFGQKKHALLSNFGLVAQLRYMTESVGPEFRQYLFSSDTEEKPFNRVERSEVYKKSKGLDSSLPFGSQKSFDHTEIKLRHSMYPLSKSKLIAYEMVYGQERGIKQPFHLKHPIMISAMSYGALGENAVRALARGARKAGIAMNTGEGGYPKYHIMENCNLVFQMGTAKFGIRNDDGSLNENKLEELSKMSQVKMIEIKMSQGAKPGKGGLLPKEKITEEIAELRGVPMGEDVISPPYHLECVDATATVKFISQVQEISQLPVGMKICLGRQKQFRELIQTMKKNQIFPDYISVDGAEGGTGAAPNAFMDDVGLPIFKALPLVQSILTEEGARSKLKLMAAGKLINPGKQFVAFSMGANAVYTARGFMMAIGCIQALRCNNNSCPVGITTHNKSLQKGLDIETKSERVNNYVHSLVHDHKELLASLGKTSIAELQEENLYWEGTYE